MTPKAPMTATRTVTVQGAPFASRQKGGQGPSFWPSSKGLPQTLLLIAIILWCANARAANRIISVSPTMTEIVYALGAEDELLGATTACEHPTAVIEAKKSGKIKVVSDLDNTDLKLIEKLQPSIVLTNTFFQKELAKKLAQKGYKVLHFMPKNLEEVFESIESIGTALGKEEFAKKLTERYRSEIREIRAKSSQLPRVKVYMEINHEGPWGVGKESPLNDIITCAGGENIFQDVHDGVFMTSNFDIVRRNPDIILSPIWLGAKVGGYDGITPLFEIYGREGFHNTTAIMKSRVLYYDSALLKHEGPRQVLAIRKLAYLLHPEVFPCPQDTIPWELGWIIPTR